MTTKNIASEYDSLKGKMVLVHTTSDDFKGIWQSLQINSANECRMILNISGELLGIPAKIIKSIELLIL
ncbi:MAG: hypothetical protein K2J42_07260 [Muribaculaceae bacterium]|nr:hypothetical protein [Muribaculaceae bacterium]